MKLPFKDKYQSKLGIHLSSTLTARVDLQESVKYKNRGVNEFDLAI